MISSYFRHVRTELKKALRSTVPEIFVLDTAIPPIV